MDFHTHHHSAIPALFMQPALFNDTMELLHEAGTYFQQYGSEEQSMMPSGGRFLYTAEMSRITLRLSSVMAWLLARRAGLADPTSPLHSYTLQFRPACLSESADAALILSPYMQGLLERTHNLYTRVARLDDMITHEEAKATTH